MKKTVFCLLGAMAAAFPFRANCQSGAPGTYTAAVGVMRQNKFCENDIKSFVYRVFAMYDKHVSADKFLPFLADKGLEMKFPETTLRSHADFKTWYAGVGRGLKSNTHTLERVDVSFPGKGQYRVDLVVFWQALQRDGKYVSFRAHQIWTLDNGKTGKEPRILTYTVEEAPRPEQSK